MAEEVTKTNGNGNTAVRWQNRRRMAWISMIAIIVVTILLLFGPIENERLKVISEPLTWFYLSTASIIGAYMGFTTYASTRK